MEPFGHKIILDDSFKFDCTLDWFFLYSPHTKINGYVINLIDRGLDGPYFLSGLFIQEIGTLNESTAI
jgi:hypothetical protein